MVRNRAAEVAAAASRATAKEANEDVPGRVLYPGMWRESESSRADWPWQADRRADRVMVGEATEVQSRRPSVHTKYCTYRCKPSMMCSGMPRRSPTDAQGGRDDLSCHVLSCLILSRSVLSCPALSCLVDHGDESRQSSELRAAVGVNSSLPPSPLRTPHVCKWTESPASSSALAIAPRHPSRVSRGT